MSAVSRRSTRRAGTRLVECHIFKRKDALMTRLLVLGGSGYLGEASLPSVVAYAFKASSSYSA